MPIQLVAVSHNPHVKIYSSGFGGWNTWEVCDLYGNRIDFYDRETPGKYNQAGKFYGQGLEKSELVKILTSKGYIVV